MRPIANDLGRRVACTASGLGLPRPTQRLTIAHSSDMSAVQLRRWTRQEYERMTDAGVLTENDRVELIGGEILTVTPQKSPHATGVVLASEALRRVLTPNLHVRTQLPLALGDDSEPEPDVAIVRGSLR